MRRAARRFANAWRTRTARLAASYVAVMMLMSLGFSAVLYGTTSYEFRHDVPPWSLFSPPGGDTDGGHDADDYGRFWRQRINKDRNDLLIDLAALNAATLLGGAVVSYGLARRTLRPIERAIEAQSRFASDASHELRTPLAAIHAENEVALRTSGLTLKRAKALLASNLEEMGRLHELSEGLLRLAREERADALRQPIWLDDVTAEALGRVVRPAQAKYITVEDATPHLRVRGDQQALVQVVAILLDNAVKYSGERTTVHLEGHRAGRHVFLSVRDEGVGITPEQLPHIFERFYRADAARAKHAADGYGLGLAIAQKIVRQQRGRLSVQSTPGKGSTFSLRLPAV